MVLMVSPRAIVLDVPAFQNCSETWEPQYVSPDQSESLSAKRD